MGKYSLIALDMDGTLLNSRLELTDANRQAIRRAAAAGKEVVVATGRCIGEMRGILKMLPEIHYMICENGSCVYDVWKEENIFVDRLPEETVKYMLDVASGENVVVQAFSNNISYFWTENDDWLEPCGMGSYKEAFRNVAVYEPTLFDHYAQKPFPVEKVGYYFDNMEDSKRVAKQLSEKGLHPMNSMAYMLEVVPVGSDKGNALRRLCAHLGIPVAESIAVGDSENDLSMLCAAGLAVGMGNAADVIKAHADVIAPDCDHDGVAWTIENRLLGADAQAEGEE